MQKAVYTKNDGKVTILYEYLYFLFFSFLIE